MSLGLLLPGVIVLGLGVATGMVRWQLSPMGMVRLLAGVALVAASTVLVVLFAAVGGFASRLPVVAPLVDLCGFLPRQHDVGLVTGVTASVLALAIAARAWRVLHLRRRAVEGTQGRRFLILETAEPIAYAAPGDPGCVVVSRGLLADLSPAEREVVLAHERAHLHLGHHRYLMAGELALAAVPLLGPLVDRLRLATERSADEWAAAAVGGDRRLVAETIARAAVMTSAFPGPVGALGGGSVAARVEALLGSAPADTPSRMGVASAVAVVFVALAAGTAQAHHLLAILRHICQF